MATIQVDLTMLPERFDLTYIDEDGKAAAADGHPPRHLRLAGAVHRHPRRALRRGVPAVARAGPGGRHPDRRPPHRGAARAGRRAARAAACASRSTTLDNRMQNKIRLAQEQKVPYMLVLGDREVEARTVPPPMRTASAGAEQVRPWPHRVAWDDRPTASPQEAGPAPRGAAGAGATGARRSDCRHRRTPVLSSRGAGRVAACVGRVRTDVTQPNEGVNHQPRPARQPDDPYPTGPGRR